MKRKLLLIPILILFLATANIGCETTAGFKTGAAITKMTAEEAHDVIYTAYLHGRISPEVQNEADKLYKRYERAQTAIVFALAADNLDESAKQLRIAEAITGQLVALVFEWRLNR